MRVGFATNGDYTSVQTLAALPIDSLWVGGHVAAPFPTPEVITSLASVVALTDGLTVGTSALELPLYPPTLLAKQIAEIDRRSAGRVVLGVGVGGEFPKEFEACQVSIADRGARTDEAIHVLRQLWTGEEITTNGPRFPMRGIRLHPAPHRPEGPPIVIAGRKAPAMRRAAGLGDGWMPYLYSPRRYAESVDRIRGLAQETGRDLAGFHWIAVVFVSVADEPEFARSTALTRLGGSYGQECEEIIDNVAAVGTPEHVAHRLGEFVHAGAEHLVLQPCGNDLEEAHRVMEEVVPELRRGSSC